MNELNLTPKQTIIFIVFLLLLLAYQLHRLSKETIDVELPKAQPAQPKSAYNHYYGAYIQLAGKRYN